MSMVCGLDLHRQQITFDALETESGEVWRGRVWQPDRERFRRWLSSRRRSVAPTGSRWRWRWRAAPAGATWSRRSSPPGSRRTWPSRPTRRRRGAASVAPRPTAPTPGCCASCCSRASCPSRGSRRRWCWSGANGCGSTSRCVDQRRVWIQRIHAELFQHGVAVPGGAIRSPATRAWLASDEVDADAGGPATDRGSATR